MKARIALIALAAVVSVGCSHAQVPPKSNGVQLSWSAPSGTGTSYVLSRITLAAGTANCPAPNTSAPNYTPLNSSTPTTASTYTDASAGGLTVCFIAQGELGNSVSPPSNTAGPFVVPANALAPSLLTGTSTSAALDQKPLPEPSGQLASVQLTGKLVGQ